MKHLYSSWVSFSLYLWIPYPRAFLASIPGRFQGNGSEDDRASNRYPRSFASKRRRQRKRWCINPPLIVHVAEVGYCSCRLTR